MLILCFKNFKIPTGSLCVCVFAYACVQASVYTCNEVSGIYSSTTHGRYQDDYNDVIAYILDYTLQLLLVSFLECMYCLIPISISHLILGQPSQGGLGRFFIWAGPAIEKVIQAQANYRNYRESNTGGTYQKIIKNNGFHLKLRHLWELLDPLSPRKRQLENTNRRGVEYVF